MTLILEDNWGKVEKLLASGEIKTQDFYCSKFASDMVLVFQRNSIFKMDYILYVDGELPGSMNGFEFLLWVLRGYKAQIKEVKIISYHPGMVRDMQDLCKEANVLFEVLR